MRMRTTTVIGMVLGLSLLLTACDSARVMQLLDGTRLDHAQDAAPSRTDRSRSHAGRDSNAATADGGTDQTTTADGNDSGQTATDGNATDQTAAGGTDSGHTVADGSATDQTSADGNAVETTATDSGTMTIARVEPPNTTETRSGNFLVRCDFSHREQVDPIVSPGARSHHLHDFFGNASTDANSTYRSMVAADTNCRVGGDTAGYWAPALLDPRGNAVEPTHMFSYYRNRPVGYSSTVAFPPDFRMIAGGTGEFPDHVWWNCHDDDSGRVRYDSPPRCTTSDLNAVILFPNCWDGVSLDSADHRSHVVYPRRGSCPASHPVKLPDVRYAVQYPQGSGGPGWRLADGTTIPHADFWNTWDQRELERLLNECTRVRKCGRVSD